MEDLDLPKTTVIHYGAKDFTTGGSVQVPLPHKEDCTHHMSLNFIFSESAGAILFQKG